jgi:hypothetical protein
MFQTAVNLAGKLAGKIVERVSTCVSQFSPITGNVITSFGGDSFVPQCIIRVMSDNDIFDAFDRYTSVRVMGGGHVFERNFVADCILDTSWLNKITELDRANKTVTVQGGMILSDFLEELAVHGFAVHNLGNYNAQSVAGAILCGTHGTSGDLKIDTFTSQVVHVKLITPSKEVLVLERHDCITLGMIGVCTEVKLKITDLFGLTRQTEKCEVKFPLKFEGHDFVMYRYNYNSQALYRIGYTKVDLRRVCGTGARGRGAARHARVADDQEMQRAICKAQTLVRQWVAPKIYSYDFFNILPKIATNTDTLYVHEDVTDIYYNIYCDVPAYHHYETEWACKEEDVEEIFDFVREKMNFDEFLVEIHFRKAVKDDARLSPTFDEDRIYVDLNMRWNHPYHPSDLPNLKVMLSELFLLLVRKGCRPHWNKLHNLSTHANDYAYDWRRFNQLVSKYDPAHKLITPYYRQIFNNINKDIFRL